MDRACGLYDRWNGQDMKSACEVVWVVCMRDGMGRVWSV